MTRLHIRWAWVTTLAAAMLLGSVQANAADEPLTVMTYNVYVGSDKSGMAASAPIHEIPSRVAAVFRQIGDSAIPERIASIADTIAAHRPHLVALQEMMLVRRQRPSDILMGQLTPNAQNVRMDFHAILSAAIDAAGLDYDIAASVAATDVEMPKRTDQGTYDDLRITLHNTILVRRDVSVSRIEAANYETKLTSLRGFSVGRGYVALDAEVSGRTYRFVSTHLEALSDDVREAQARELMAALDGETLPVVLAGDFNSDADGPQGSPSRAVYELLTSHGYTDVWQGGPGSRATCCQAPDLRNAESALSKRIDYIFVRNFGEAIVLAADTFGARPSDRLPSGLWPSDHAGVVVSLSVR